MDSYRTVRGAAESRFTEKKSEFIGQVTPCETWEEALSFVEAATLKPDLLMNTLAAYAEAELPRCEIRRTHLYALVDGQPVPLIDL